MSLPDMDTDTALAAMTARLSSDPDDVALGRVLAHVSDLSAGPAPQASAGLAAFLAAKATPAPLAAPVVVPTRSRKAALAGVLGRLTSAGLAAKVVLGAAGVALAGTTSLGAAALVDDDVPARRIGVTVEQPVQGGVARTPAAPVGADDDRSGAASDTPNGGTAARRADDAPAEASPTAVDAHTDGKGRDDERAAVEGGGTREPRADKPARDAKRSTGDDARGRGAADGKPKDKAADRADEAGQRRPDPGSTGGAVSGGDRRGQPRDDAQAEDAPPSAERGGADSTGGGSTGGGSSDLAEPREDGRPQQSGTSAGGKRGRS